MTLRLGYVEGVTPAKWMRIWAERFPDTPLESTRTTTAGQTIVLIDDRADVALVRLPLDTPTDVELSVIPLYEEIAVVVAPKDHAIAAVDALTVAELSELLGASPSGFAPTEPDLAMAMELVASGLPPIIVPHSIARLHSRKDLISRPVTDAAPSRIAIAWRTDYTSADIEEFVGVVRGRTARSSRGIEPETKANGKVLSRADKAKAAARAVREASPAGKKKAAAKAGTSARPKPNPGRGHGGTSSKGKKGKRR